MSKLSNTLGIPSFSGGAGSNVMGPLKGMAPGWDGVPTGVPSGLHKAIGDVSSPLGGLQAKGDGTPEWRNAPIDVGQNALVNPPPPPAPKGPGYSVWGDPDITKRGWGWGMGANGALYEGDHSVPWGGMPNQTASGQPTMSPGTVSPGGQRVIAAMRSMAPQGPAMGAGSPNATAPGLTPQPSMPWAQNAAHSVAQGMTAPGQNFTNGMGAMQQLIAQLRAQQPQQQAPTTGNS